MIIESKSNVWKNKSTKTQYIPKVGTAEPWVGLDDEEHCATNKIKTISPKVDDGPKLSERTEFDINAARRGMPGKSAANIQREEKAPKRQPLPQANKATRFDYSDNPIAEDPEPTAFDKIKGVASKFMDFFHSEKPEEKVATAELKIVHIDPVKARNDYKESREVHSAEVFIGDIQVENPMPPTPTPAPLAEQRTLRKVSRPRSLSLDR